MRKQKWNSGDCFAIPLRDGGGLLAQVIRPEPKALNGVSCALFDQRVREGESNEPDLNKLFSTLLTTHDLLGSGRWKVIHSSEVKVPIEKFPYESLREKSFVGAKIRGSRIVENFANAFCGLHEWDCYADPNYFDCLLITPQLKPHKLIYKKDAGEEAV